MIITRIIWNTIICLMQVSDTKEQVTEIKNTWGIEGWGCRRYSRIWTPEGDHVVPCSRQLGSVCFRMVLSVAVFHNHSFVAT